MKYLIKKIWMTYQTHGLIEFFSRSLVFLTKGRARATRLRVVLSPSTNFKKNYEVKNNLGVLFLSGVPGTTCEVYRVNNLAEALSLAGVRTEIITEDEIDNNLVKRLPNFDVVVFSRTRPSTTISQFLNVVKTMGIVTVFEIDDYLFNIEILPHVHFLKKFEYYPFVEMVAGYILMFYSADYFITTTDFLASKGRQWGKRSFVIRNFLNKVQLDQVREQRKRTNEKTGVKIGYFPGSLTHNVDFSVALPAIIRIFDIYKEVELHIVGCFEIPEKLRKFSLRVKHIPYINWKRVPEFIAKTQINIAPLESNNPFCEGKSEIKYLEAGQLKVPTIASNTSSLRHAIVNGKNGFLANNDRDWFNYLEKLITDEGLRRHMGENAQKHIFENYTPQAQAPIVYNVLAKIIQDHLSIKKIK